jgi:hypothetical protein
MPISPLNPMADAWRRYRLMRLAIYCPGDDRQRAFLRPIFIKALRAAWAALRVSERHAETCRRRNAEADDIIAARNDAFHIAARALSPAARQTRIRAILEELRLLPYRPLSIDIGAIGADLRAELAALQAIATPERKAA